MRVCKFKVCTYFSLFIILTFFLLAVSSFYHNASSTLYPESTSLNEKVSKKTEDRLGQELTGLFWFVQVTDIHLSIFRDKQRISEFEKLCGWLQNVVR
jgi:hypothetical protein